MLLRLGLRLRGARAGPVLRPRQGAAPRRGIFRRVVPENVVLLGFLLAQDQEMSPEIGFFFWGGVWGGC